MKEGEHLSLEVKVPLMYDADVTWYRDEQRLKEDHHVTILSHGDSHRVNLFNVSIKDEAVYKCVATNPAGSTSSDCEVIVEGGCCVNEVTSNLVPRTIHADGPGNEVGVGVELGTRESSCGR